MKDEECAILCNQIEVNCKRELIVEIYRSVAPFKKNFLRVIIHFFYL